MLPSYDGKVVLRDTGQSVVPLIIRPLEFQELWPLSISQAQLLFPVNNPLAKRGEKEIVEEMVFFWVFQRQWSFLVVKVFAQVESREGGAWLSGIEQKFLLDRQVTELPEDCKSLHLSRVTSTGRD